MKHLVAVLTALLLATACGESPEPAAEVPTAPPAAADGGVDVRILRKGYGRPAAAGDELTVHTTGWLYDGNAPDKRGEQFWSSHDTGQRLTFTLGAGQMIRGWDEGLPGMLVGEVRELTIPPDLGYGESGRGPIPPDSTLVFEVELFSARSPDEVAAP